MLQSQKNKKEFLKPFKDMIKENGENGLIYIPKECIIDLIQKGILKNVHSNKNVWYDIELECDIKMSLIKATPDYYKLVSGGNVGHFLQHYEWKYDGKNLYSCSIFTGRTVKIERVILNYDRYGFAKNAELEMDVHHMWFRFCALVGTLKSMSHDDHMEGHHKIGNYDRGQSVQILNVPDFQYFITEVYKAHEILQNRKFSIEF